MSYCKDGRPTDEQQILALHEAGDRAPMSADLAVLAQIFADDYLQRGRQGSYEAGCAEEFSNGCDSLSVDCFHRTEDSRIRRHCGRARLGIRRSRSQRKAARRALRLPRRATEIRRGVEAGGFAVAAADGKMTPNVPISSVCLCVPCGSEEVFTTEDTEAGESEHHSTFRQAAAGFASATRGTRRSRPTETRRSQRRIYGSTCQASASSRRVSCQNRPA